MEKEVNKLEELQNKSVKIMCELALIAFDKLPEETRKIEFSKLTIGSLLIKKLLNLLKNYQRKNLLKSVNQMNL